MSHTKHVTDAVISANRANAKLSTRPRSVEGKQRSSSNSLRHGILATKIHFNSHPERKEFLRIRKSWQHCYEPHGTLMRFLVEEVALISWKLGMTEAVEVRELLRRQDAEDETYGLFKEIELPVAKWDLPVKRGWDCEEVIVRVVTGDERGNCDDTKSPGVIEGQIVPNVDKVISYKNSYAKHLEVQAVLGNSLNALTRYRSALKRDLYRAFEKLDKLRDEQSS